MSTDTARKALFIIGLTVTAFVLAAILLTWAKNWPI
jgi:hypothetical protein